VSFDPNKLERLFANPAFVTIGIIVYLGTMLGSMILGISSQSSLTLGVYRAELNAPPDTLVGLLKDGFTYFWRILGVTLLVMGSMLVVFLVFLACLTLGSVVTMGLAAICFQPLFLLMIPLMILVMAFMEQAESAIVADDMRVMDSARQAYELIKSNFWKYVLITVVIYVGMNLLMSVFTFPLLLPMFFMMVRIMDGGGDFNNIFRMQAVFGIVILPIMALVQGFSLTYLKSAMMVTYLRITRSTHASSQPIVQGATAYEVPHN